MSNRGSISNVGADVLVENFKIDASTITYSATAAGGSTAVGLAVTLSADDTIALVADGGAVVGKLLHVESDGIAAVATKGVVELPGGDEATLTRGLGIVGDLGAASAKGYIRAVAPATAAELGVARGQIRSVGDPTKVVVAL